MISITGNSMHASTEGSVFEVPDACKSHCYVIVVRRLNNLIIAHRASRLDDRGCACFHGLDQAVGEREEGVGGNDRMGERQAGILGFSDRKFG